MCAFNKHYCWPGTCGTDGLTKDCQCAHGFVKRFTEDYSAINAGETTCQPKIPPEILTCDTVAVGPNGEKKQALSTANSTECQYLADMYGHYQPVQMQFKMASEFTVTFNNSRPDFIKEENFGISDSAIHIMIQTVTGNDKMAQFNNVKPNHLCIYL
ncbi:hypothetical protein DPMN_068320 [Dreissena polymorpha]|uniref:Uncharacterized protein n=1 Tax=Dreissena polymorpha TaxID=45954 RepID=A0A9D3Z1E4_DREPO|nr:hypothetical protein DPMN_068320 [Dreissena polymorpha]